MRRKGRAEHRGKTEERRIEDYLSLSAILISRLGALCEVDGIIVVQHISGLLNESS